MYNLSKAQNRMVNNNVSGVEIKPDLEKLRAYTQTKLALADQLRLLREALIASDRKYGEQQCGELILKLAEDRFTLAVLGQFKRGKSSLMNAIIGNEVLPTGVLPLTSAITVLKYGPVERLIVNRIGSIFPDELPVSALPDYVTEKGNPANQKKVKTACVELPIAFLRRGIEFVDTPGIGSAIKANTETTYRFLPECDAVLLVTSIDTPMTSLELEFLKEIQQYVNKIFFVINKIDLVTEEEKSEVLEFIVETIRTKTGNNSVRIFPVSARLGLTARMSDNKDLYASSGLKALEEALITFLSKEKASDFLAAVAQKALRILDDEAIQLAETRAKLDALYSGIIDGRKVDVAYHKLPQSDTKKSTQMKPRLIEQDIMTDFQTRGCPVCQHIVKQASDFFANWQYQISTEEKARNEFETELGFCPLHTWQLVSISSSYGASIGYAQIAEQIAHHLRESNDTPDRGNTLKQLVHNYKNCRVCKLLRQSEERYILQLAMIVGETYGRSQYRHSQGACLRHLGMLMDAVPSAESRDFLISFAAQRFEEDVEDMRSYAMKRDALRRELHNSDEEDAYRRAIIRIVGDWNVCMPWPKGKEI